jgi:hypothetical protein
MPETTIADSLIALSDQIHRYTDAPEIFAFYGRGNKHLGTIVWIPPGVNGAEFLRAQLARLDARQARANEIVAEIVATP